MLAMDHAFQEIIKIALFDIFIVSGNARPLLTNFQK